MAGYSPLKITGMQTGLVQERENFLLPDDAYPVLQNAYVWRERILRKKGYKLLGRLQRNIGTTDGAGNASINILPIPLVSGVSSFTIGTDIFVDPQITPSGGLVTLLTNSTGTGTLNRTTGVLTITASKLNTAIQYFPGLPVMGIRIRELLNSANNQTVVFDQSYAYKFNDTTGIFQEFIAGTTWNASNKAVNSTDFFWSTNYWTSDVATFGGGTTVGTKLFWVTNNSGASGANADPPRITDGISWVDFDSSTWNQIDATNFLFNYLCNLPFRGRMVTFNTWEGTTKGGAQNYSNRIRWSVIGNPFIKFTNGPPAKGSWRSDIRGQGGFLDIPTSEDIISVGFVRDNLIIYCERSTWQLRYTGRAIAPFQIEKVNSELGAEGTFSTVQFDTSLVGIGDKGIVECDSYKSERIDIKIPDFVFQFQGSTSTDSATARVHGIRDFENRLAYWTVPIQAAFDARLTAVNRIFPNTRLVYNYENDSWALFSDSLTTLGTYQPQSGITWLNTKLPWIKCDFAWINQPAGVPAIIGGNQQGFLEYLDKLTVNDVSLYISNIVGQTTTPTVVTSPNHNMQTGTIIGISGIPNGSNYANLNGGVFFIITGDQNNMNPQNNFRLMKYNTTSGQFSTPQLDVPTTGYVGGGLINIRDNFSITSKKFNFLDEGQSIQLGYVDILMEATGNDNPGAISMNVYLDYDDVNASNILPKNEKVGVLPAVADTFFNSIVPTNPSNTAVASEGTKFWQRVFCPTRANFVTIQYTFNNAQMAGQQQALNVQIDAQVLWIRKSGRMTQT